MDLKARLSNSIEIPEQSTRSRIVEQRTYLRPVNDEGTLFETFEQSIDRMIEHQRWLWERAKAGMAKEGDFWKLDALSVAEEEELEELRVLLLQRKATLAGRTRWLGGTDVAKKRESSMFNCFGKETQFITTEGVLSFADTRVGARFSVPTHTGGVKEAVVISGGEQSLNEITLVRGRSIQTVRATADHEWILKDGSRTRDLKVGDRLLAPPTYFNEFNYDSAEVDEQSWWAYGYVYGDGTLSTASGSTTSRVRLCGAEKDKYLHRFVDLGFSHSFPPSCDNDPIVYTGKYLKTLPDSTTEKRLLRAFIHGYLTADGARSVNFGRDGLNEFKSIQATNPESQQFIETMFPVVGLYISNVEDIKEETNFGLRSHPTKRYSFSGDFGSSRNQCAFSVKEIKENVATEEVFCLTVTDDHSFVLPNGIVTGNCSFLEVRTVYDVVDVLWLLLQGCGVGFRPIVGVLNGFQKPIKDIRVVRSTRTAKGGCEHNVETFDRETGVWTIKVGDSAEAWAKAIGKLVAGKKAAKVLVLDFSEVRPAGERLKGYGWISSGDEQIAKAFVAIARIFSKAHGRLLTRIEILDLVNWLGTVLSSRRSAEICLMAVDEDEWKDFAVAKSNWWDYKNEAGEVWTIPKGMNVFDKKQKPEIDRLANEAGFYNNEHRQQSNNSLMFYRMPTRQEIEFVFDLMVKSGGSEPGFANAVEALRRAPWFKGGNPCFEILLGDRSFCNLVETVLFRFNGDEAGLLRAHYLIARANYRQTCVWLDDGILQRGWHELNEYLHLCGVGVTGVVAWDHVNNARAWNDLRDAASTGADGMADELGMPHAKAVTTIKPSGTQSKTLSLKGEEVPEGIHKPLGRFIFNNVGMSEHEPMIPALQKAGYDIIKKPGDSTQVLVKIPVEYAHIPFDKIVKTITRTVTEFDPMTGIFEDKVVTYDAEVEVNLESAIDQLERYKMVMENYVDHNCSITVSYDPSEVPAIVDWFEANWNVFVGVSFLFRNDPTKTAQDLGFAYLPQEVVDERTFREYESQLSEIDWNSFQMSELEVDAGADCATGACPVR